MSLDVYAPCPCGSGKKLKFCCHAVAGEMGRIDRLRTNNQPRMALQALDQLDKLHPDTPWIVTNRAAMLLDLGDYTPAVELLNSFLETHPEHSFAAALHATGMLMSAGYQAAKPSIQRALQRSSKSFPEMMGNLMVGVAALMHAEKRFLAARQYLVLAMRLCPEEDRQQIFLRLLEFDSNGEIPYPLRSVHDLLDYQGTEEREKEARKARRLSDLGCWELAARLFTKLADQEPENPVLWQNAGFCRAWDGDEVRAAHALHKASALHTDFETAVECETIAQLLDLNMTTDQVKYRRAVFHVTRIAKLLSLLDEQERLARLPVSRDTQEQEAAPPVAVYQLLDRPLPSASEARVLTRETVPVVLAQITIFAADDRTREPAEVSFVGVDGEQFEDALKSLREWSGSTLEPLDSADDDEDLAIIDTIPREYSWIQQRWYFSNHTPVIRQREMAAEKWKEFLADIWPTSALSGLGGKTPVEAADIPEMKVAATATLYVLDAFCDQNNYQLDTQPIADRLGIAVLPAVEVTETTPLNTFTAMQLHRLPVENLSDVQLTSALNRALLIRHDAFLYQILREVLNRPTCTQQIDLNRVYLTLSELAQNHFDLPQALEWIAKAREHGAQTDQSIQDELKWLIRELVLRLEDPSDEEIKPLSQLLWNDYGEKVPAIRNFLAELMHNAGHPTPTMESGGIVTPGIAGEGAAGATTRPQEGQTGQEPKQKLWLPGQS